MIKISIIIPVYNVEPYIEECLLSVANQTFTKDLECIIVDDCGKDNSIAIAQQFVNNYNGNICFSIIHHQKNGGLSVARNTGIKAAKGEYLYFLDSDDTIVHNCIELMYGFIEKYGKIDLVQGSFYENEEEKVKLSPHIFPEYSIDRKKIKYFLLGYYGDIVMAQCKLIKKEIIYNYNLWFKKGIIHEDNHWTFFVAKHIKSMAFCNTPTYYHRYNPTSITKNINISKEYIAFSTIITDCCNNIDSFMRGRQKEYLLCTLLCVINNHYYETEKQKNEMINTFLETNNTFEAILFDVYKRIPYKLIKEKILHILFRLYKAKD